MSKLKFARDYNDLLKPGRFIYLNIFNYNFVRIISQRFDLIYFDGVTLLLITKLLKGIKTRRMSPDNTGLMNAIVSSFDNFIVCGGSTEDVNFFCKELLIGKNVILQLDGFKGEDDLAAKINQAIERQPNLAKVAVLLGLGSPKQEIVSLKITESPNTTSVYTIGGYISQFRVKKEYFPKWVDFLHIRALYRMAMERHLFLRMPKLISGAY